MSDDMKAEAAPVTPGPDRRKGTEVTVAKAKGRPMLTWVGKRALGRVTAYPAQLIERYAAATGEPPGLGPADWSDWPAAYERGGLLFHGDNRDVLAHLLANGFRGRVKLIYIGEYLGMTRTRTDPFFDGTRGRQLVKMVPLNHPLSPLDCEVLRLELKSRPQEERDILLVCLGIEHAARDWIERHNHQHPINQVHVIDMLGEELLIEQTLP